jgi:hypothetical protein
MGVAFEQDMYLWRGHHTFAETGTEPALNYWTTDAFK